MDLRFVKEDQPTMAEFNKRFGVLNNSTVLSPIPIYEEAGHLSDLPEGSVVNVFEDGEAVEFYIAKHGYEPELNGVGKTLVTRKILAYGRSWNNISENAYATSAVDSWLNTEYKNLLSEEMKEAIGMTKFYYTPGNGDNTVTTLERAIFILSATECGYAGDNNVEGSTLPTSSIVKEGKTAAGPTGYIWTRSPDPATKTNALISSAEAKTYSRDATETVLAQFTLFPRPSFCLPSDLPLYKDSNGNYHVEQAYKYAITDLDGNELLDVPGAKIERGQYKGTGVAGESNPPNEITFGFVPKCIIIAGTETQNADAYIAVFFPDTSKRAYNGTVAVRGSTTGSYTLSVWVEEKTVKWTTTTTNVGYQLNNSNIVYKYIAIG